MKKIYVTIIIILLCLVPVGVKGECKNNNPHDETYDPIDFIEIPNHGLNIDSAIIYDIDKMKIEKENIGGSEHIKLAFGGWAFNKASKTLNASDIKIYAMLKSDSGEKIVKDAEYISGRKILKYWTCNRDSEKNRCISNDGGTIEIEGGFTVDFDLTEIIDKITKDTTYSLYLAVDSKQNGIKSNSDDFKENGLIEESWFNVAVSKAQVDASVDEYFTNNSSGITISKPSTKAKIVSSKARLLGDEGSWCQLTQGAKNHYFVNGSEYEIVSSDKEASKGYSGDSYKVRMYELKVSNSSSSCYNSGQCYDSGNGFTAYAPATWVNVTGGVTLTFKKQTPPPSDPTPVYCGEGEYGQGGVQGTSAEAFYNNYMFLGKKKISDITNPSLIMENGTSDEHLPDNFYQNVYKELIEKIKKDNPSATLDETYNLNKIQFKDGQIVEIHPLSTTYNGNYFYTRFRESHPDATGTGYKNYAVGDAKGDYFIVYKTYDGVNGKTDITNLDYKNDNTEYIKRSVYLKYNTDYNNTLNSYNIVRKSDAKYGNSFKIYRNIPKNRSSWSGFDNSELTKLIDSDSIYHPIIYRVPYCFKVEPITTCDCTVDPTCPGCEPPTCKDDVVRPTCYSDDTGTYASYHETSDDACILNSEIKKFGYTLVDNSNPYCSVACKDDIDIELTGTKAGVAGMFFKMNTRLNSSPDAIKVGVQRTCKTSKINTTGFEEDFNNASKDLANSYNLWQDYYTIYLHLLQGTNISQPKTEITMPEPENQPENQPDTQDEEESGITRAVLVPLNQLKEGYKPTYYYTYEKIKNCNTPACDNMYFSRSFDVIQDYYLSAVNNIDVPYEDDHENDIYDFIQKDAYKESYANIFAESPSGETPDGKINDYGKPIYYYEIDNNLPLDDPQIQSLIANSNFRVGVIQRNEANAKFTQNITGGQFYLSGNSEDTKLQYGFKTSSYNPAGGGSHTYYYNPEYRLVKVYLKNAPPSNSELQIRKECKSIEKEQGFEPRISLEKVVDLAGLKKLKAKIESDKSYYYYNILKSDYDTAFDENNGTYPRYVAVCIKQEILEAGNGSSFQDISQLYTPSNVGQTESACISQEGNINCRLKKKVVEGTTPKTGTCHYEVCRKIKRKISDEWEYDEICQYRRERYKKEEYTILPFKAANGTFLGDFEDEGGFKGVSFTTKHCGSSMAEPISHNAPSKSNIDEMAKRFKDAAEKARSLYETKLNEYAKIINQYGQCYNWTDTTQVAAVVKGQDYYELKEDSRVNRRNNEDLILKLQPKMTLNFSKGVTLKSYSLELNDLVGNYLNNGIPTSVQYQNGPNGTGKLDVRTSYNGTIKTGEYDNEDNALPKLNTTKVINCKGVSCYTKDNNQKNYESVLEWTFFNIPQITQTETAAYAFHMPSYYSLVPTGKAVEYTGELPNNAILLEKEAVPIDINTNATGQGYSYTVTLNSLYNPSDMRSKATSNIWNKLKNSGLLYDSELKSTDFDDNPTIDTSGLTYTCKYKVENDIYIPCPGGECNNNNKGKNNYFWRIINMSEINPLGRDLGYNWTTQKAKEIEDNMKTKDSDYQELTEANDVFEFILTPAMMKTIRDYNKETNYGDFKLSCHDYDSGGYHCDSYFLNCLAVGGVPNDNQYSTYNGATYCTAGGVEMPNNTTLDMDSRRKNLIAKLNDLDSSVLTIRSQSRTSDTPNSRPTNETDCIAAGGEWLFGMCANLGG